MPRKIVEAGGGTVVDFGGIATTSTRSPGSISPETPLTLSIEMLIARIPGVRRTGKPTSAGCPTFESVIVEPAGIVISESAPITFAGSVSASGSTAAAGRVALASIAAVIGTRAGISCAATRISRG